MHYIQGGAKIITLLENTVTFVNGAKCHCHLDDIISRLNGINSNGLSKEISQPEPKFFIKKQQKTSGDYFWPSCRSEIFIKEQDFQNSIRNMETI